MPRSLPSTASAMPTDEVPPRMSSVCPRLRLEAHVERSLRGLQHLGHRAERRQGSSLRNGITCVAGTTTYSA